ncbi:MAG: [FeFe] hydrogenase H-cluster maturation GTPase HydF [Bacteroidales bacterium]|nr:[FeFe] hydrogenase H-cluster maturation GTPase HydF [Bacteroidales bacterium]
MKGNELKPRIGIFGRRNYGKSSLINYLTGQNIAIVSDTPGATTDPVRKTMELGGVGPVIWIDTAGIDDSGALGTMRVEKSLQELKQCDLAVIILSENRFEEPEETLVENCKKSKVPFIFVFSQSDRVSPSSAFLDSVSRKYGVTPYIYNISSLEYRLPLLDLIRDALPESAYRHQSLLAGIIAPSDRIVMVTPIDSSAPEGRMILPQVQVLRDILDNDAVAVVCKETELQSTLNSLPSPPRLVITDSQVFGMVSQIVPESVPLTSFSIVLARAKGLFEEYIQGTSAIDSLNDGDRILILESCTHNVTCEDIGRVKLPKLLLKHTGKQLHFDVVAGLTALQTPITDYSLVVQCGGCVVTPKQLVSRLAPALDANIPVSNYGLALAYLNGIFPRAIRPFQK